VGALIYVNSKFAETAQEIWDGILRWYETAGEPLAICARQSTVKPPAGSRSSSPLAGVKIPRADCI
jgi:hypothetical protein